MTAALLVTVLLQLTPTQAAPTQSPISVAVFPVTPLEGVQPLAAAVLTDQFVEAVRDAKVFDRVSSPLEVAALMPKEQQEFLMRCSQDECTVVDNEIAGALGVTHALFSTLARLGESMVWTVRLIDLRTALVRASTSERVKGGEEKVLDVVRPVTARLMAQAFPTMVKPASTAAAPTTNGLAFTLGAAGAGAAALVALTGSLLVGGATMAWLVGIFASPTLTGLLTTLNPQRDEAIFMLTRYVPPSLMGGVAVALVGAGLLGAAVAAGLAAKAGLSGDGA